jgi:uncharacterized integral membrane protein (TIGR00697 family)
MVNEFIFLIQIGTIASFSLGALKFGKEALVTFVCICCILSNLFVLKQTTLFGLNATCSDAFTIGATLGLNMLQEYFGRHIARITIIINFFFLIFYAIMTQIQLAYAPSIFDTMQPYYFPLFQFMPRIMIASITVYVIAQMTDYTIYGFLKNYWHRRLLVIRNYISIIISQFIDTVLFTFLGLYGIVQNPWEIIIISYAIKLIAIFVATPFVGLSKRII